MRLDGADENRAAIFDVQHKSISLPKVPIQQNLALKCNPAELLCGVGHLNGAKALQVAANSGGVGDDKGVLPLRERIQQFVDAVCHPGADLTEGLAVRIFEVRVFVLAFPERSVLPGRIAGAALGKAGVLPDGKAAYIRRLQAEGHRVAMVGDGINDSAALAQADLSIAMGQGSDIAMDVAKITIMTPDLGKIADAIRLSAATVRTIRQNLFWAFIYNLIGVPVAAGVLFPLNGFLLNPMLAGAAMALSSVSVVANSLRLKAKGGRARKNDGREPIPINNMEKTMEKKYRIEGMMCGHCRMHVEKALNGVDGVRATVELEPPVATVEFSGGEKPLAELQRALDGAGEYKITEV